MRERIRLILALAQFIPLAEVIALVRASHPLPESWTDDAAVRAWLTRMGVVDPLAALILAATPDRPLLLAVDAAEVEALVDEEAAAAGDETESIATWLPLVIELLRLLGWLRG